MLLSPASSAGTRSFALSITTAVLLSSQLCAQAVYSHTSPAFGTGVLSYEAPCSGLGPSTTVSASITYSSVLPPNLKDNTVFQAGGPVSFLKDIPSSWLFTDGVRQWTPSNSHFYIAVVDTDASGNITGWDLTLYSNPGFSDPEVYLISSTPSTYGSAEVDLTCSSPYATAYVFYGPGADVTWAPPVVTLEVGVGKYIVLHNFCGPGDGCNPRGLVRDSAGNLYGTTLFSEGESSSGQGTVFKVDTSGHETVLHTFTGSGGDGLYPEAGVILDSVGNLYGTTDGGGSTGQGTVYKVDTSGRETVIHSFNSSIVDGYGVLYVDGTFPFGALFRDMAGILWGTTAEGGNYGNGTVFRVDTSGAETVAGDFTGSNGNYPVDWTGLVMDSAGNLWGTTAEGGGYGSGTVFEFTPSGPPDAGITTALYSFTGGIDGTRPLYGPIMDSAGNLYGTTYMGGAFGYGTLFKVNTVGLISATVLHSFTGMDDGANGGPLLMDSAGNLYGATVQGGAYGNGIIFKLDTAGNETVLYSFTGGNDGGGPEGLIMDSAGNLYGIAFGGGASGGGTVFALTRSPLSGMTATASGLAYSRVSQTFDGTVTIMNTSNSAVRGPLQILFNEITPGVTLVNATNSFYGIPYLTVASGLAPGQSATVDVQFKNPSDVKISFTPAIYSGSI
jgi:uncharacterized repeat protein (TIGR03803 family)